MKKILMACGIVAGLASISNNGHALKGTTQQRPNGSIGGITTTCPSSSRSE